MELQSALELRDEMLDVYYNDELRIDESIGVRAHGLPVLRTNTQRISVGARFISKDVWKLAIRVQKDRGRAMSFAQKVIQKKRIESEVDVAVVEAQVPPIAILQNQSEKRSGVHDPGGVSCRPPQVGYSIGHLDGGPGTLGLFALRDGNPIALSCNHVLAIANRASKGDFIFQAGPPDSEPYDADKLGTLGDFVYLKKTGSNAIDAAYCIIDEDRLPDSNALPEWAGSHAGRELRPPIDIEHLVDLLGSQDARIAKVGRRTGLTSVPAVNVTVGINDLTINVPGIGNCRFDNLVEIEAEAGHACFSDCGDSGAVIYETLGYSPFGMIFCGGTTARTGVQRQVSYACSLSDIFGRYSLEPLD
ncbi:MAG: hypothetical protein AAGB04_27580 [Pseudomonadota bacterium]